MTLLKAAGTGSAKKNRLMRLKMKKIACILSSQVGLRHQTQPAYEKKQGLITRQREKFR
jgi:hypothetical protein